MPRGILVVAVAFQIREALGSGYPAQDGDVRRDDR